MLREGGGTVALFREDCEAGTAFRDDGVPSAFPLRLRRVELGSGGAVRLAGGLCSAPSSPVPCSATGRRAAPEADGVIPEGGETVAGAEPGSLDTVVSGCSGEASPGSGLDAATKTDAEAEEGAESKAETVPEAGTAGMLPGSGDPEALPGTGEVFPDPMDTEKDPPARVRASGASPAVPQALPALAPITASDAPDTGCPAGSSRAPASSRCSRTVSTRYRRRSLGERYMDSSRWKGAGSPEDRMRTAFSV